MVARAWSRYRLPLLFYGWMTGLLLVVQHISNRILREDPYRIRVGNGLRYYVDGWSQFDGPQYQRIAEHGYFYTYGELSNIVWFPVYPILLRWAERPIGDYLLAGILVSFLGGAWAVCAYWSWLTERGMDGTRRILAFAAVAFYPYGWYLYGVIHSDALFLALLVSAFLLVERKHLVAAGMVAALATATRPTGMALIPAIIVFGFQRDGVFTVPDGATGLVKRFNVPIRFDRSKIRAATFGPVLSVVGLGSWMAYLWIKFGDPIAFITNQRVYHPGGMPLFKPAFIYNWTHFTDDPRYCLTTLGQAIVLAFVFWSVPAVCRRFGFAYGLFVAVLAAIPTVSTEDFMGTGRYLMAAFPVWALFGERLAARTPLVQRVVVGVAFCFVVFMAFGFSRSWYLT